VRIRLKSLHLICKRAEEKIDFDQLSYFYGEIGAGKSTIARLIDYCMGGKLVMTPALQQEFVSCALDLSVDETPLWLARNRDSHQVEASWGVENERRSLILPIKSGKEELLPESEVYGISDLFYYLGGQRPPRVRRSQIREDSDLERLSMRDLLWYCYLDQETMDSAFFHLDRDAEHFRRLKSRNVMRFILGTHHEEAAELELELEALRQKRYRYEEGARALAESLEDSGFSTEIEVEARVQQLVQKGQRIESDLRTLRESAAGTIDHATEHLRAQARHIVTELDSLQEAIAQVQEAIENDTRHLNQIRALSSKVQHVTDARDVLQGIKFVRCPACTRALPEREGDLCPVCGQEPPAPEDTREHTKEVEADIRSRASELEELIRYQRQQLRNMKIRLGDMQERKRVVDAEISRSLRDYDSVVMSQAVTREREAAGVEQEIAYLRKLKVLPAKVDAMRGEADTLRGKEEGVRRSLREARESAEKDVTNLKRLAQLFLDCLVRARLPGVSADDAIKLEPPWYLPAVINKDTGDFAEVSYQTIGSGGKRTLFKCCFALAVHRLAREIGAILPDLLVIDTPMKNISERENRAQWEGFHQLVYELLAGELNQTQMIIIDKEFHPPPSDFTVPFLSRHMRVDDEDSPPLIRYYRDHPRPPAEEDESSEEQDAAEE